VAKAVLVNGSGAKEVHPSMMIDQVGVEMIALPAALETLDHWENGQNYLYYEALYGGVSAYP